MLTVEDIQTHEEIKLEELLQDPWCEWEEHKLKGLWHTGCNVIFDFDYRNPIEAGFLYCPFCGRRLVQLADSSD